MARPKSKPEKQDEEQVQEHVKAREEAHEKNQKHLKGYNVFEQEKKSHEPKK